MKLVQKLFSRYPKIIAYLPYFLIGMISLIGFWKLGGHGFADWDEATYADISRNLLHGKILVLQTWKALFFEKPPLFFWLQAMSFQVFGVNEFAARLVSVLSGIGLSYLTFIFSRNLFGRRTGIFVLVFFITNSFLLFSFRFATIDVLALFLTTLATYYFWLSQENKKYLICSMLVLGLVALTKGPVSIGILLLFFIFTLVTKQLSQFLKSRYFWTGLIIFLTIAVSWHMYMFKNYGSAFWDVYFWYHIVKRSSEVIEGHTASHLFYLKLIVQNLPAIVLLFVIPFTKKLWSKIFNVQFLFLVLWFLIQYITIEKVATKLSWYILPVFIPLTILVAYVSSLIWNNGRTAKFFIILTVVLSFSLSILKPYSGWSDLAKQDRNKTCLLSAKEEAIKTNNITTAVGFYWPSFAYYIHADDSVFIDASKIKIIPPGYGVVTINNDNKLTEHITFNEKDYNIIMNNDNCKILEEK
jgi:4-amino-4-deoxy-L-arabinose transferase-like glycosyltransferase